jgi:hypothetical protein
MQLAARKKPSVYLGWSMPFPVPQTGLSFEVWQSNKLSNNTWAIWQTVSAPPVQLANNQPQQFFKVRALQNGIYSGWAVQGGTSTTNAPTPAPSTVTLGWDPSPDSSVYAFQVYQGASVNEYTNTLLCAGSDCLELTVPGLLPGATYTFAVTAFGGGGFESPKSLPVTFTAVGTNPPPTPSSLRVYSQ